MAHHYGNVNILKAQDLKLTIQSMNELVITKYYSKSLDYIQQTAILKKKKQTKTKLQ